MFWENLGILCVFWKIIRYLDFFVGYLVLLNSFGPNNSIGFGLIKSADTCSGFSELACIEFGPIISSLFSGKKKYAFPALFCENIMFSTYVFFRKIM